MGGATAVNVDWLLLSFVGAIAVLAATVAVVVTDRLRTRARVTRRMRPLGQLFVGDEQDAPAQRPANEAASEENALAAWLKQRFPLAGGVRVGVVILATVLAALLLLVPFLMFVGVGTVLAVVVGLVGAAALAWNVGRLMEDAQRTQFNDRLLLAMDDLQRMARFGIPTLQALNSVTDSADAPLQPVLRNALLEAALGVPLERAIAREARRVRMGELAMLSAILSTQARTGGNLSEAVGNLADMLRERKDNRTKLKASTAESRLTLVILAVVPFLGIGMQVPSQPELLSTLLNEGRHLLGIGIGLIAAGFAVSFFMIRSAQR